MQVTKLMCDQQEWMHVEEVLEDAPCAHPPQARLRLKRAPARASHADQHLQGSSMAVHTLPPCMPKIYSWQEVFTMTQTLLLRAYVHEGVWRAQGAPRSIYSQGARPDVPYVLTRRH